MPPLLEHASPHWKVKDYFLEILSNHSHAHSQACESGVAKLSQRSHVVQNVRAYFVLYVLKTK